MLSEKAENPKGKAEIVMRLFVADWLVVANIPKKWLSNVISSEGVSGLMAFMFCHLPLEYEHVLSACNLHGCPRSKSRMNREVHVRFWERFGGEIPPYLLNTLLPPCHVMQELSPANYFANGLAMCHSEFKLSPFAIQMQVGTKMYHLLECLTQFAFDHGWIWKPVAFSVAH